MQTDYEKQAQDFLDRFGIKFRATLSDSKTPQWAEGDKHGHHYRVTLSKGAEMPGTMMNNTHKRAGAYYIKREPKRLTFDFWGSIADAEKGKENTPGVRMDRKTGQYVPQVNGKDISPTSFDKERALSIATEACLPPVTPYDVLACISGDVHCPETFEDFTSEYGYDADSIKALQMFRRCSSFAKRLREFFTPEEIEALSEIQ